MRKNTRLLMKDFFWSLTTDFILPTFPFKTSLCLFLSVNQHSLLFHALLRWVAAVVSWTWTDAAPLSFKFPCLLLWCWVYLLVYPLSSLRGFLFPVCNPLVQPTYSMVSSKKQRGSMSSTWEEASRTNPRCTAKPNSDYITLNAPYIFNLCVTEGGITPALRTNVRCI